MHTIKGEKNGFFIDCDFYRVSACYTGDNYSRGVVGLGCLFLAGSFDNFGGCRRMFYTVCHCMCYF
jgi:hypothetical protein